MKGILLKKVMFILYFKSCEWECQIIIIDIPRIGVAFVQDVYHIHHIFAKSEISFEVSTFGGLLFLEGSLHSEVCYFQGVITFGTLRSLPNRQGFRAVM